VTDNCVAWSDLSRAVRLFFEVEQRWSFGDRAKAEPQIVHMPVVQKNLLHKSKVHHFDIFTIVHVNIEVLRSRFKYIRRRLMEFVG
jgi:hypothetical protein